MSKKEKDRLYAIAEYQVVMDSNDGDGLDNDPEPVVLVALGVYHSSDKAQEKCDKLNEKCPGAEDDRYQVVSLEVQD